MAFFTDTAFTGNSFSTSAPVRRDLHPAVTALEQHGRVVIVGGPKSGKTFLAHALLHHFHPRFTTHIICSTQELRKHLNEQRPRILLMDGTLGEVGVDMEEYKVWRALLPRLMMCTDVRHCLVVVTCYPHVLLELQALEEGSNSFLLQDTCTVSLKEMAEDERKEMLHHFLSDLSMTQQEKHALVERVLKDDISGATFPWCCARLVQRLHNSSLDDPSDVFTCPAESYVTLLHRMLMDPTHGETVAALLCLTMMGLSDFFGNQHNTHTALRELGFRECSAYTLERAACFLKNFILSEDCSTFFSRVLYDAAGLALGRSHLLPVLLKICDIDFLVKYVHVWTKGSNLFLTITLTTENSLHVLMERILADIGKGKLKAIPQFLSLQNQSFLEELEMYNRNRKNGKIQIEQAVDPVHRLPLLYWSMFTGCEWLVDWCLDFVPKDSLTALHVACGTDRGKIISHLVKHGADGKVTQTVGLTPLQIACRQGRKQCVSFLLGHGLDINGKLPGGGASPLHHSLECQNNDVTALLLDRGADVNDSSGHDGQTPLHYACQYSTTDTVALLLDRGANINICDLYFRTALHFACENANNEIAALLLERGADITAKNYGNWTPEDVAQGYGHTKTVQLLKQWAVRHTYGKPGNKHMSHASKR